MVRVLRFPEMELLLAALVPVSVCWLFLEIADEVGEGQTRAFDRAVLLAFRNPDNPHDALGPRWFEESVRDLTSLGSSAVLLLTTLAAAGYLILQRKGRALVLLLATTTGGALLTAALKMSFARPRPDLVPHLTVVQTASFPSGHAALSAMVYLTLSAILAQMATHWRLRAYFVGVALFVTMIVGVTRVYTGVHYPSDVLAGWTLGLGWSTFAWLVTWALKRRGMLRANASAEPEAVTTTTAT